MLYRALSGTGVEVHGYQCSLGAPP